MTLSQQVEPIEKSDRLSCAGLLQEAAAARRGHARTPPCSRERPRRRAMSSVKGSISKPSCTASLAARIRRAGSALKVSPLTARMTRSRRSASPPVGVHETTRLALKAGLWQRERHGVDGESRGPWRWSTIPSLAPARSTCQRSSPRICTRQMSLASSRTTRRPSIAEAISRPAETASPSTARSRSLIGLRKNSVAKSAPHDKDRDVTDCEEVAQPLHKRRKIEAAQPRQAF